MRDPVYIEDGWWYFYDETWSYCYGPFPNRGEAEVAHHWYLISLDEGVESD